MSSSESEEMKKLIQKAYDLNKLIYDHDVLRAQSTIIKIFHCDCGFCTKIKHPEIIYRFLVTKKEGNLLLSNNGYYIEKILNKRSGNIVLYARDENSDQMVFGIGDCRYHCERAAVYLGECFSGKLQNPKQTKFKIRIFVQDSKVKKLMDNNLFLLKKPEGI